MGSVNELATLLEGYLGTVDFLVLICFVIAGIFVATQAYGIFIKLQTLEGALLFGYLGYAISSLFLTDAIEGINLPGIIGIACAGLGALIFVKLLKFSLFILGGLGGWVAGSALCGLIMMWLPDAEFLQTPAGIYVISGVAALILGFLFMLLFKPLYIITTSFGGGVVAGVSALAIVTGITETAINIGLVAGLVVGLICCIVQFKRAADEGV